MGDYLGTYKLNNCESLGGMRIGSCSSGALLVEQWIAGWAAKVKGPEAAKVRGWFQYFGKKHEDLRYGMLGARASLIRALQDDTDNCTWVRAYEHTLNRVDMRSIKDRGLYSLLCLWHGSRTMYELGPYLKVTPEMAQAVLLATESLEEQVTAWAPIAREACTIIQRAHEQMGYVSIG